MRQNKTANEVAQRFGLTYAPIRVKTQKKKVRFNANKLEEVYSDNKVAVEITCIIAGGLLVAIVFVLAVLKAIGA